MGVSRYRVKPEDIIFRFRDVNREFYLVPWDTIHDFKENKIMTYKGKEYRIIEITDFEQPHFREDTKETKFSGMVVEEIEYFD